MNKKSNSLSTNHVCFLRNKIQTTEYQGNNIIYSYDDDYIQGKTVQCELFCGTWMIYYDLKIRTPELFPVEEHGEIRLNYCVSGRCELTYKNNKVHYIGNGDLITVLLDNKQYKHDFPLGTYKGLSIVTTAHSIDTFLKNTFKQTEITAKSIVDKLKRLDNYLLIPNHEEIKSIMEEIICVKDDFWKEKSIICFSKLILLLYSCDIEMHGRKGKYMNTGLCNKVKYIKKEVTENMESYMSIEEISKKYLIPPRTFSECFKQVYGKTYYAFIKEYRIKKSAELILTQKDSITEIALSVGYQNAGKFSKAFCDIMGVTPLRFRKSSITGLD